jgi:hypothetical protein
MLWYKKIGRILYSLVFFTSLISTGVVAAYKSHLMFRMVLVDFALVIIAVILEVHLYHLSHKGTEYVEVNRSNHIYDLEEITTDIHKYFVIQTEDAFILRVTGESYNRDYKRHQASIIQDRNILKPILLVSSVKKVSKAADNEYSLFAIIGEKIVVEEIQIIVRNKSLDLYIK